MAADTAARRAEPYRPPAAARVTGSRSGTGSGSGSATGSGRRPVPRRAIPRRPLRGLTVLYDPRCKLCSFVADWLARQRQLVPIDLVPTGSGEALRRFPELDHAATAKEITAVGDQGQVYRGDNAFIVCLWALAGHREFAHTLTRPAGRRLARAAVLSAAKYRGTTSHGALAHRPARPPGKVTYGMAPGWTYDRVTGWSQAPGPSPEPNPEPGPDSAPTSRTGTRTGAGEHDGTCTDGCGPAPG